MIIVKLTWTCVSCVSLVGAARLTSRPTPKTTLCVGSNATCAGNSCCPGYAGSAEKSFPCLTADDTFDGCDVSTKYGMYNASVLDFSNVVFDRISADTENTGEVLIGAAGWWAGQRVDLLIQAVDQQGSPVSTSEAVIKAVKPEESGYLLRFDFQGSAGGKFRFNFGQWEDDTWIPFEMRWATISLTDIDCGNEEHDCEVMSSADHSFFQAGNQVEVNSNGNGTVTFRDRVVAGSENNPDSVSLSKEQQDVTVSLFFEHTDHFSLSMTNHAQWPRSFLVAGITNVQWPSMEILPTKVIPETVPPTPWPTPAPVVTFSPRPTCPFTTVSGSCVVQCTCVSSPNYPQNYAANDSCVVGLASPTALITQDFSTERFWDALHVNGESFSGTDGPEDVVAEGAISWQSDKIDQDKGWHLCADLSETVPTPAPPTSSPTSSMESAGPCELSGATCVQSPNYPLEYGHYQTCTIRLQTGTLYVDDFFTEKFSDTLTVDGVSFSGQTGPGRVKVSASSEIVWSSDWSTTHKGWRMCTEPIPPTPAPTTEFDALPQPMSFELSRAANAHIQLWLTCGTVCVIGGLLVLYCILKWSSWSSSLSVETFQ